MSLERVYMSVVNGTGIKCGKKYTTKKGTHIIKSKPSHAVMGVASRLCLDVTVMDYGKCWKLGTLQNTELSAFAWNIEIAGYS